MTRTIHPSKRTKFKGRSGQSFLALPSDMLAHPAFVTLSHKAKSLLLDIGRQYNGHNNGDLAVVWSQMSKRNWKSKQTLRAALKELEDHKLVELTRQGGRRWPSLYAVTWQPIHECMGKLDVAPTNRASRAWRQWSPSGGPNSSTKWTD